MSQADSAHTTNPSIAQVLAFPKRKGGKSFYDLYPMPFFDKSRRCCWAVQPTGDYRKDLDTGRDYAVQFLSSCDGTVGWSTLLGSIVCDISRSGDTSGLVIGFMRVISAAMVGNLSIVALPEID